MKNNNYESPLIMTMELSTAVFAASGTNTEMVDVVNSYTESDFNI